MIGEYVILSPQIQLCKPRLTSISVSSGHIRKNDKLHHDETADRFSEAKDIHLSDQPIPHLANGYSNAELNPPPSRLDKRIRIVWRASR
jgi:hypothetical protein